MSRSKRIQLKAQGKVHLAICVRLRVDKMKVNNQNGKTVPDGVFKYGHFATSIPKFS